MSILRAIFLFIILAFFELFLGWSIYTGDLPVAGRGGVAFVLHRESHPFAFWFGISVAEVLVLIVLWYFWWRIVRKKQ